MDSIQYQLYLNVHEFATKWRKYKTIGNILDEDSLKKAMQYEHYVKMEYYNEKIGKTVICYLLSTNSKYGEQTQEMRKLLSLIRDPCDIIVISKQPLKNYITKAINQFKLLRIKCYLHENFALIIPNGPLCYEHKIMDKNAVYNLLNNDLRCSLINLPKISVNDVQCIWVGAEVGDVLQIKIINDITGISLQYRVVIPSGGKVISFRHNNTIDDTEEAEDDEVEEHRELNANKADDEDDEDEDVDIADDAE